MTTDQPDAIPECPTHLDDAARVLWHQLARQLGPRLTVSTAPTLEIACQNYATWLEHTERVRKEGAIVKAPNGNAVQHPSIAIAAKAADGWRKFSKQLGLDAPKAKRSAGQAFLKAKS